MLTVDRKEQWNPEEKNKINEIIDGSYSHFLRLERRNLLLVSSITIVSIITAISPNQVSVAGINFERFTETTYYSVLFTLISYFLVAFWIFFSPKHEEVISIRKKLKSGAFVLEYSESLYSSTIAILKLSDIKFILWLVIQYYLPLAIGCLAALCALTMIIFS